MEQCITEQNNTAVTRKKFRLDSRHSDKNIQQTVQRPEETKTGKLGSNDRHATRRKKVPFKHVNLPLLRKRENLK